MTGRRGRLFNPYPGLRPFREAEAHLFFGRSAQTDELLAQLRRSRFVAVMGPSGSGKSSLVRAGLLPALHGGFSLRVGSHWRIATFRPGANPIHHLAAALASPDVLGPGDADPVVATATFEAMLRRSRLGLADVARRHLHDRSERLLVVVDQFEELFRFEATARRTAPGDAASFVQLLIHATREDAPVDVMLTMRSDFLGDCARFRDLPEAINDGLYLVPRLTRSQLREAITAPAAVGGGAVAPRLVQRLLNDAGADPDTLPVVQHALMRTWDLWAGDGAPAGPLDIEHYQAGGGLEEALARHADEAFDELAGDRERRVAEAMFKRLTELGDDGREVRRPSPVGEIAAVAAATPDEVGEVIEHFSRPGRSFVNVSGDGVVDISHESLIRQWPRLRRWAREEAESRDLYRRVGDAAERWERGEAALLHGPDLEIASTWWRERRPNAAWAERYHPSFDLTARYLDGSRAAARRRRLVRAGAVVALAALAVISLLLWVRADRQKLEAQRQERLAVARQLAAESGTFGDERRVPSMLTALEALRATEADGLRLPAAEEALRRALQQPLGSRLPVAAGAGPLVVAFGPGGSTLATGGPGTAAALWDADDREAGPTMLAGPESGVTALAFSPDGAWLAAGTSGGPVLLWDTSAAAEAVVLEGHADQVTALAFSPDGGRLATASRDGDARLWPVGDAGGVPASLAGHEGFVAALDFSPDGSLLVTGGGEGSALLWQLGDPAAGPRALAGHTDAVTAVAFSPDGRTVATAGGDGIVRTSAVAGGGPSAEFAHRGPVNAVAFSPDGRWLATGSADRTARLWGLADPANPIVVQHADVVEAVAFSGAGRWLATGGRDNTVRLLDLADPVAEPFVLGGHDGAVTSLGFDGDGRWLATGGNDGSVWLWDLADLSTRPAVLPHASSGEQRRADVTSVAFAPDGRWLATGTTDKAAWLWDPDEPADPPVVLAHEDVPGFERAGVFALAFSPDGSALATGGGDRVVRLFDPAAPGAEPRRLPALDEAVTGLSFSPDGRWLAATLRDPSARLWDAGDLAAAPVALAAHGDDVTDLAFSPDGLLLATAGRDGAVLLHRPADPGAAPGRLEAHEDHVTAVAFGPEGRLLATGGQDDFVVIWEVDGDEASAVHRLPNGGPVSAVAFHPSRPLLATAGGTAVRVWDLGVADPAGSLANPVVLRGHDGAVTDVAFSLDGRWLATAGGGETARLWLQLDELAALACRSAGRNLTLPEWQALRPGEPYERTCEEWPAGT